MHVYDSGVEGSIEPTIPPTDIGGDDAKLAESRNPQDIGMIEVENEDPEDPWEVGRLSEASARLRDGLHRINEFQRQMSRNPGMIPALEPRIEWSRIDGFYPIQARYSQNCSMCPSRIEVGHDIVEVGGQGWVHAECCRTKIYAGEPVMLKRRHGPHPMRLPDSARVDVAPAVRRRRCPRNSSAGNESQ